MLGTRIQVKTITKYSFILLSVILIVITFFDYINYRQLLVQIEKENMLIEVMFGGWVNTLSFIIITLYELITKNKYFKAFIQFILTLFFFSLLLKDSIPIEDFDAGVENTITFLGIITILLFIVHGLKKIYDKINNKLSASSG